MHSEYLTFFFFHFKNIFFLSIFSSLFFSIHLPFPLFISSLFHSEMYLLSFYPFFLFAHFLFSFFISFSSFSVVNSIFIHFLSFFSIECKNGVSCFSFDTELLKVGAGFFFLELDMNLTFLILIVGEK